MNELTFSVMGGEGAVRREPGTAAQSPSGATDGLAEMNRVIAAPVSWSRGFSRWGHLQHRHGGPAEASTPGGVSIAALYAQRPSVAGPRHGWRGRRWYDEIIAALRAWDPDRERGLAISGPGVIPDLVWVSAGRAAAVLIDPETGRRDGKLHAAPDLAGEVISPGRENEERDRETKQTLYSRRGVLEYWIVDRFRRTVEVHRRWPGAEPGLELAATLTAEDTLTSPRLPGFALPVERIFRLPGWLPR